MKPLRFVFLSLAFLLLGVAPGRLGAQGSPNVMLLAQVNSYPTAGYNDCWGYTAPDGREYALLGVQTGTSILDITDTDNIVEVAFIPSATSLWKDIKTYQHYAYVVTEASGGMQIIDLSDLPNSATLAATYTGFSTSHNIFIDVDNALLYAEGTGAEPVRVLDISNPLNPVQISTFGIECHDIFARDNMAYIAEGNSGSIGVYDLNTPTNPTLLARFPIPASGYVHNCWLSDDNQYLITTEETNGKTVKLWDISDLNNPTITSQYLGPNGLAHNAFIKGHYAYISHYAAGLRILDISDPNNISEIGYYQTPDAWGTYPFFASGKVLISDIDTGLYVVFFQGAQEADPDDPRPPENVVAYSDYTTPDAIQLTWTDPHTLVNGDTLLPGDFVIDIYRGDSTLVASVAGGLEQFTDTGLSDGQFYQYTLVSRVSATDSTSLPVQTGWHAGGAPQPAPPAAVSLSGGASQVTLYWINPTRNVDGTPMDDFAGIRLYQDSVLVATLTRTSSDTGRADSATFTPATPGLYGFYLTAVDNEIPVNESEPSPAVFTPLSVPVADPFPQLGAPDPQMWFTTNASVTALANNPPSPPGALNFNGDPEGGDVVDLRPTDLSGMGGAGVILSYAYQPQGNGNAPEPGDVLQVYFKNNLGQWVLVKEYAGNTIQPFQQEVIDLASAPNGGGTYYHSQFQVRFQSHGSVGPYDDWFIDDVFLGTPTATPILSVTPTAIVDSLYAGYSVTRHLTISNVNPAPSVLSFALTASPTGIAVDPTSGSVASGHIADIQVTIDATGLAPGSYQGNIHIVSNDTTQPALDVPVVYQVLAPPVLALSQDTIRMVIGQGQQDSSRFWLYNAGGGFLTIASIEAEGLGKQVWTPRYQQPQKPPVQFSKGAAEPSFGALSVHQGTGDPFGYQWIDSDAPGGPTYQFVDISTTGTPLTLQPTGTFSPADEGVALVPLPFPVLFYGTFYDKLVVSSNGFVTFDTSFFDNSFNNQNLPSSNLPNNLIAAFWDDLDGSAGGKIYTQHTGNRFVIQWHNWGHYPAGTENMIFQIVLTEGASTLYLVYEHIVDQGSSTFGIENMDGTAALQIAYNQSYAHDQLLTKIFRGVDWLSVSPTSGGIAPGDSLPVQLTFNTANLTGGTYQANLIIASNDPARPILKKPAIELTVTGPVGIGDEAQIPDVFALQANYPNPFNPSTTIEYLLPEPSQVQIDIFNLLGQKVKTLVSSSKTPGTFQVRWDGTNYLGQQVGSGIYIYRMTATPLNGSSEGRFVQTRKMVLIR